MLHIRPQPNHNCSVMNDYLFIFIFIFNNTLAQEYNISNYSETTLKPMWITLPSTANIINTQEIKNIKQFTSNSLMNSSSISDSYECLDTIDNTFDYDSIQITPHWTPILFSPEPHPTMVNVSEL